MDSLGVQGAAFLHTIGVAQSRSDCAQALDLRAQLGGLCAEMHVFFQAWLDPRKPD